MHHELAKDLSRALALWCELTDLDPNTSREGLFRMGWEMSQTHEAIRRAFELDPTNVVGGLILEYFFEQYLKQRKFDLATLLRDPARAEKYVAAAAELQQILSKPHLREDAAEFTLALKQGLRQYNALTDAVEKILANPQDVAWLRRDALESMDKLRVFQFLKGKYDAPDSQPTYNKFVHLFWNVNSLLAATCHMPPGIALNLVQDQERTYSYFVFSIRNGGNVYLLTDIREGAHPFQKFMSRSRGLARDFAERVAQNWFPYQLMDYDLTYTNSGNVDQVKFKRREGLVPYQHEAAPIKAIAELEPSQTVWLTLMFDLIVDRFWRKQYEAPQLAYTAENIKVNTPLLEAAKRANLPVNVEASPLIVREELTVADVKNLKGDPTLGSTGSDDNDWMVEAYADRVPPEVLNFLETPTPAQYTKFLPADTEISTVTDIDDMKRDFFGHLETKNHLPLYALDATKFGTPEQLDADRLFVARYNLAQGIQREADADYFAHRDEVRAWFKERVTANVQMLLQQATDHDELSRRGGRPGFGDRRDPEREHRFMKKYPTRFLAPGDDHKYDRCSGWVSNKVVHFDGGFRERDSNWLCYLNQTAASYQFFWTPATPEDLAELAGCTVADLPHWLKNWYATDTYHGNSILDRIDPVAWALHNPWTPGSRRSGFGESFNVHLFLSARELNRLRSTKK